MSSRRLDHSVSVDPDHDDDPMRPSPVLHMSTATGFGRFSTVHGAAASVQIRGSCTPLYHRPDINGSVAHRAISCRQQCHGKGCDNTTQSTVTAPSVARLNLASLWRSVEMIICSSPSSGRRKCHGDVPIISEGNIVGHNEMVGKRIAAPGRAGAASFSVKRMACATLLHAARSLWVPMNELVDEVRLDAPVSIEE